MRVPKSLRKGDTIRIVSPAKKADVSFVDFAKKRLQAEGFEVELGANCYNQHASFAGTDTERLHDFQEALNAPHVKAILCARGGYGSMRIMQSLDWRAFRKKAKWICGFSDITAFHSLLHTELETCSLHASMPLNFEDNTPEAIDSLIQALKGKDLSYDFESHPKNRTGIASACLVGGNLSMLHALRGSPYQLDLAHKILFIEEVSESFYHIDRMLMSMKLSGELDKLAGLIIGGMTDVEDKGNWFDTKAIEDLVLEKLHGSHFPVVFDFPAGHIRDNRALILGKTISLTVGSSVHLSL